MAAVSAEFVSDESDLSRSCDVQDAMQNNDFDVLVRLGQELADAGREDEALTLLRQACIVTPDHADACVHYTITCLTIDPRERVQHAQRFVEIRPDDCYGWLMLGNLFNRTGDYEAALAAYLRGHAVNPAEYRLITSCCRMLWKLERDSEADRIAEAGVALGALHDLWQRPPHLVQGLSAHAWRDDVSTWRVARVLEANFDIIRSEVMAAVENGDLGRLGTEDTEGLTQSGRWTELNLIFQGVTHGENSKICPKTTELIESELPEVASMVRGAVKISVLTPGTTIRAHYGPSNTRMRTHLGIMIPDGAFIRAGNPSDPRNLRQWQEGRVLCFDDSFRHEVWHRGSTPRIALIADTWHPDLDHRARLRACEDESHEEVYLARYFFGKERVGWD